ncbi:hypothetical protein HPB50_013685 [Hyalomma asiaticum]|uniref:Uncharacterized protein n=1 Tax=Hyalomma asiaticum TaxID=266040 RepID=A0ACB7TG14_HYAAI|nr:hypothetical protein HPB50_013685 [Hyalomma asiaticum]
MVEFWWGSYLANVLSQQKKEDKERGASQVVVLGENVELPDNIYSLLKKGPKFSLEPVVQPHELLAFNRRVANRAPQEQHDRCLLEGVDALALKMNLQRWYPDEDHLTASGVAKEAAELSWEPSKLLQRGWIVVMKANQLVEASVAQQTALSPSLAVAVL